MAFVVLFLLVVVDVFLLVVDVFLVVVAARSKISAAFEGIARERLTRLGRGRR